MDQEGDEDDDDDDDDDEVETTSRSESKRKTDTSAAPHPVVVPPPLPPSLGTLGNPSPALQVLEAETKAEAAKFAADSAAGYSMDGRGPSMEGLDGLGPDAATAVAAMREVRHATIGAARASRAVLARRTLSTLSAL